MAAPLSTRLNNGTTMPLLGLGVYDMHGKEAEQAVTSAIETGYRLIDTAAVYGNEKEVGNAVRQSGIQRDEFFITTKVADKDQGFDTTLRAFDVSLKKIGSEYIDLYLVHWPLRKTRQQTWQALESLYKDGKVKAIGVSNYLIPFLKELDSYASIVPVLNQVEFSPYLYLKDLLEDCRNRGIQLQAYTPLVRGRKMSDPRLVSIANMYNKTPAQIILRWMLQLGVSAVPKSSSLSRLKENFAVFDFELRADDMASIETFNENLRVVDDPMGFW